MTIKNWLGSWAARVRKTTRRVRLALAIETLEQRLAPANVVPGLQFNGSAAALSLVGSTAVVRGLASGGIAVTLDGHLHSSDAGSPAFDPSLAGASAAGLRQISLSGGSTDSLTLGTLMNSGALTVRSDGGVTVAGTVRAAGLSVTAAGLLDVAATGQLTARGGSITLTADQLVNTGRIDAGGTRGGTVVVTAHDYLDAGLVSAAGSSGAGGQVRIAYSHSYIDTATATTTASGTGGTGGQISVRGGRLFSSGRFLATGTSGGAVDLLGHDVLLVAATVDASGTAAGGRIRVGGDYQGGPALPTASTVDVSPTTSLRADGAPAGRVIVWSAVQTTFAGSVSAHGGGKPGFIEVSSHGQLDYGGKANAGQGGTLLLDPKNLVILKGLGGTFPQFNLVNPAPGGAFGTKVVTTATGNEVVTDPNAHNYAGAVYLFDGRTGSLLSTLVGSTGGYYGGDYLGSGGVTFLTNGNYVISSPSWNNGTGAATWGSGNTGVSGVVSSTNSLVGGGSDVVTALSNGNYVATNQYWNNNKGAATWGNGTAGTSGTVSASNSLVGSTSGDYVGNKGVTALANGNYVVISSNWNNYEGAVTWGNGNGGTTGAVSSSNSLVGSNTGSGAGDYVGSGGVVALPSGNYVVVSPSWQGGEGAVTWGTGSSGAIGLLTSSNSLVGSTSGNSADSVGSGGIKVLSNGNYVVLSPHWGGNSYGNGGQGAVTWGSGTAGVSGVVSSSNSLVGGTGGGSGDRVGIGGVTALNNGNYVVCSPDWSSYRGAATWGDGTNGTTGTVSASNSLVGTHTYDDYVSNGGVTALSNGNYVVCSYYFRATYYEEGAATWGNGATGTSGTVTESNSLVGTAQYAELGSGGVTALTNGNYVVVGASFVAWGNGSAGTSGTVSAGTALASTGTVIPLPNGDYVVDNSGWNNNLGAVTWENGSAAVTDTVSSSNSLVGASGGSSGDKVGSGGVKVLANGNYVVLSPVWNLSKGAATWGNGTSGTSGVVGPSNSLVGTTGGSSGDQIGSGGIKALTDGNFVVSSPSWNNSTGAASWLDGTNGTTLDGQGNPDTGNSLLGSAASAGLGPVRLGAINGSFVAAFPTDPNGGRVTVGFVPSGGAGAGQLAFGFAPNLTITESPDVIAEALDAGTNVVLQANDDITVSSPITVVTQGKPGSLTLQAGRSILLQAGINTAGGDLTLTANDTKADGVIDSQRDTGNAAITMSTGIVLNTGGGNLFVDLKTSTDKTNNGKGVATLLGLTTGQTTLSNNSVLGVTIDGQTPGDGVTTGTYTQTSVTGPINLNGATLQLTHLVATSVGETFTIIHSTGGVSGTFAGLAEGADITASDGTLYQVSYQGNGGKDVVLTQLAIPTQLQVTTQPPVSVTAGAPFSLAVSVEDAQGNVANGFTGTVTLALAANPGGDTLSGTLTVQAQNGVAHFSGLSLDKAASGITFQATCANLTPATTSPAISVTAGSPTHLVVATGLPSNITAGVVIPSVVIDVVDLFGNIVTTDNSSVTIVVATGPGTFAPGSVLTVTSVNGIATFDHIILQTAGSYSLGASDSDTTLTGATTNTSTVQPSTPSYIGFVGQVGTVVAGQVLTGVVVDVYDQYNNVLTSNSSFQVTISIASGPGTFTANSTLTVTVQNGVAIFNNLILDATGTYTFSITASSGSTTLSGSDSSDVTVDPGTPDHLVFIGSVNDSQADSPLDPVGVAVVDKYGNLVAGDSSDQVTVAIASGPGKFTAGSTTTVTVSGGTAEFSNLVLDTAGSYTLAVSSGSLKSQPSGSFSITPLAPDHLGYGSLPGTATAGQALSPAYKVQLFDAFGNLVTNNNSDLVTITVTSGPGTFTAGSTATVSVVGGVATFGNLVLTVAGDYTFTISTSDSLNGSPSGSTAVQPAAPNHLAFLQQPGDTAAGSAIAPAVTVQLFDAYGNLTSNDNTDKVTMSVTSGGPGTFTSGSTKTVTVQGGLATFSNLVLTVAGTYTLSATGPGTVNGPASTSFTVAPLAADHLAFSVQPSDVTAGVAISSAVKVQVLDKYNNLVAGDNGDQVTMSVASGPGDFSPDSTRTATVSNGVASFSNLILDTAGQYTLAATGTLSSPASNPFTVNPAAADHLQFIGSPGETAAGSAVAGVQVGVYDRFGNPLTGDFTDQVSVAIANGPGNFATGSTTTVTVINGAASFSNLVLTVPGQYSLSATATGNLKGPNSGGFQIDPAAANQLVFSVAPADTTAGVAIGAVKVQVLDRFGNLLTQDNTDQLTVSASGPGGFTATSTPMATLSGGIATFNNLVLDTAGPYTLTVSGGSLPVLTSSSFHVNPAAADHLSSPPLVQPGRSTAGTLLEVQVAVEDHFNNVVTTDNSTVSVSLGGNPSGVTLGGTLTQPVVNGIATFNDLTISGAGNFGIQASDSNPAVAPVTTSPFEVDQLSLSSTSVLEFRPTNTLVGNLGVQGGSGHTYHYTIVKGASSPDAKFFTLNGNQLLTADAFDFAARSSYTVRVRATDEKGFNVDQVFTINVADDPALTRSGKTLTVTGTKGNDTFSFAPGGVQDSLTLNGTKLVVDTASVNAVVFQGGGGSDSATLSGSAGVDTLTLSPAGGTLVGAGYTVTLKAVGHVTATGGPKDVAKLTGSAGSDTFTGSKGSSTLSGKGYSLTVLGFPTVSVDAGKGLDKAILSASTSGNAFVGNKGTGTLGGSGYSIVLTAVEDVTLNGKAGTRNTIHLAQVSYKLHQNGVWVKV